MILIVGWNGTEEELQEILEEFGDFEGVIIITR